MPFLWGALFMINTSAPLSASDRRPVRILCLGDSLTEGYGLSQEESWPALVENLLHQRGHKNVALINAGVSGSTTASALSRLKWHAATKPQILILALGANDGLRGLPVADTQKNLAATIDYAQKNGMKVLLAGMKMPPNYGPDYTTRYEKMFAELARRFNTALMPFILEGVASYSELNLPDGIHPNAAGYKKIAVNILPYIETLL